MSADYLMRVVTPGATQPHAPWPFRRSALRRYGVAVLAVAVAFIIRYFIYSDLENRLVFTFFVPAAMVAAWYGGLGPGLLAVALGALIGDFFFIPPRFALWPLDVPGIRGMIVYSVTTLLCVGLSENLHRHIRRLEQTFDRARTDHHRLVHAGKDDPLTGPVSVAIAAYAAEDCTHGHWPFQRPLALRFGVAILMVAAAFLLRYWTFGSDDNRFPFLFFVPASLVATWYGGMAPGLVTTAAGLLLGDYFFLSAHETYGPLRESERMAIGLFAVTTTLCVMLFESLHNRIRRLEHALERARHPHAAHADHAELPSAAATPH
jgi:K+-sensing histidine kinase KdpD